MTAADELQALFVGIVAGGGEGAAAAMVDRLQELWPDLVTDWERAMRATWARWDDAEAAFRAGTWVSSNPEPDLPILGLSCPHPAYPQRHNLTVRPLTPDEDDSPDRFAITYEVDDEFAGPFADYATVPAPDRWTTGTSAKLVDLLAGPVLPDEEGAQ